ncbi:hypothetical protein BST11_24640 [Mycobacterium alsense]|uniref:Uncharacterized protein n=1 Tax=Mycobacterium alsense TaxID=324058 RepID=A0ABX3R260_9MYCO|nr:hypothetical protein BST11_24640 [Mycobacterium alsense]
MAARPRGRPSRRAGEPGRHRALRAVPGDAELEALGTNMAAEMEQYRGSALHRIRTTGRAALVRGL